MWVNNFFLWLDLHLDWLELGWGDNDPSVSMVHLGWGLEHKGCSLELISARWSSLESKLVVNLREHVPSPALYLW